MIDHEKIKHWRMDRDSNDICWVTIDRADTTVNTLHSEVMQELDELLEVIEKEAPAGVVIRSGKESGFVFGADISQFGEMSTEEEAQAMVGKGQAILARLAALPMPTVALIHGNCLGGGFELALACDYRAVDRDSALMGLPETKLGLLPGWGGTVRLHRLIGPMAAFPLILQGRMISARRAKRLGIANVSTPARHLKRAAIDMIKRRPAKHRPGMLARLMNFSLMRPIVGTMVQKTLRANACRPEHYPAPYAVVRNWVRLGVSDAGFKQEVMSISKLLFTPTSRSLINLFFLQNRLKRFAKSEPTAGKRVHVVGAGTMGGDIAAWCALQGYTVTLQDQSPDRLSAAFARASKLFASKAKSNRSALYAMDRLQADVEGYAVAKADYIIEAVFEDLAIKQELFRELEKKAKPTALLATNTSSILLESIGEVMNDPHRLVGIHFFNPVSKMELVEVVITDHTPAIWKDAALRLVRSIKRLPLPVASKPGFLVNRVLVPYLLESISLFDEGMDLAAIDEAALSFGMPMGPITLADKVGLDVCYHVAKNLLPVYGGTMPACLEERVEAGCFGLKTGEGFYKHGKKPIPALTPKHQSTLSKEEAADRMVARLLNEGVACCREEIVSDPALLDAGMVFGTGFAPFTGGPMSYIQQEGVTNMRERLKDLAATFGDRFQPDAGWDSLFSAQEKEGEA